MAKPTTEILAFDFAQARMTSLQTNAGILRYAQDENYIINNYK
jgi:hypothetical protein